MEGRGEAGPKREGAKRDIRGEKKKLLLKGRR